MPRFSLLLPLLIVAALLPPARPAAAAPRCFPEAPGVSACIDGRIAAFWAAQGGLPVFGYPLGPAAQQGELTVQRFERARLELHPANPAPYDVLLGRLGADALAARGEPPAPREAPRPGCRQFEATGLNVCGAFLDAYSRYGLDLGQRGVTAAESLALFGLPLTAPRQEQLGDGRSYTVQWFERARFEDHGAQGVLFGLLSVEAGGAPAPAGAPASGLEPGGFVTVQGDGLLRLGRPVQLKGVNYYPQGRPWAEMWSEWDGPQIERELRLARDQLGINMVRVLLPDSLSRDGRGNPVVGERVLNRMRQLAQIAGDLDLRLMVALFDFSEAFPAAGTQAEAAQLAYLRTLIGNFAGDERIVAWDIHNEPDHYELWRAGRAPEVLDWLGRMADEVRRLAPNQLVTVGMAQYQHLLAAGPDGRRVVDYSDVVSVHIYNAADAARQLDELRRATGKPILLQEFGWPTGPACYQRDYSEAQQEWVYRTMLEAARGRVAGVVAWTLRDYDPALTYRWETREEYYGLYRPDGTLKPAATHLAAWPGEPLPSSTRLPTALTVEGLDAASGLRAPVRIGETGRHVKGEFRNAYEVYNGRFSFGPPVSEAFVRPEDGRVVQYFSGAVLAYHPEAREAPGFGELLPQQQLEALIRPEPIGQQLLASRGAPAAATEVDPSFERSYRALGGRWRFGPAITPKLREQAGGVAVELQYFQHGSLQRNPATGAIEPGPLGSMAWEARCASMR